ncbi:3-deoxy-D-arabinoheptulosonate-7-phosphate synthase [Saccharopolyspora kobensis]|uniref:Phospho-2-dehydro-3-deoxyheptonate aldolase n=1 Tax=Saccharopolyspora kobensis TaxID=146035 RepID=A0A1H5ZVB3_9PSEU|nr:3-deoxy-7-phosphoheptulonate synthase [Saccharopolyspora kobensis]SEG39725.1 3-deoxy-D-arabinoheptulosonate-7-phosphate synthase [Saccharopolyspora kobensis]SFE14245.1 3-deoxy-D-arabinoheptulosonate-7-phosphate synthase [Saccharopolyspora kobensis]
MAGSALPLELPAVAAEPPALAWPDGSARVLGPLPAPAELAERFPRDEHLRAQVAAHRRAVRQIVEGADDRLLVIVGPCSVHDPDAALHYAHELASAAAAHDRDLLVVMRAYLEKPRTSVGWKGLLHDPHLDGGSDLAAGLAIGREFLVRAAASGLPLAYEFVDPFLAPYVLDLVSWGALGARTVASQPHRQLASALPMPVGMKNAVTGDVEVAIAAVRAARAAHTFPGVAGNGAPAAVVGAGNPACHVVLRGGAQPNYDAGSVGATLDQLRAAGLGTGVVVDASHGNSGKDHRRQPGVVQDLAAQVAAGNRGLRGVMVESFLGAGSQDIAAKPLRYGVSVTDGCLDWPTTAECLRVLAGAVRRRRNR